MEWKYIPASIFTLVSVAFIFWLLSLGHVLLACVAALVYIFICVIVGGWVEGDDSTYFDSQGVRRYDD
jgi:hypothetical protein